MVLVYFAEVSAAGSRTAEQLPGHKRHTIKMKEDGIAVVRVCG